jgi:hypothetical protein
MNRSISAILLFGCVTANAFSQIKVKSATMQQTIGGMGGSYMNYVIEIKNKPECTIAVDSILTASDSVWIKNVYSKRDAQCLTFTFSSLLSAGEGCKACPSTNTKPINLTKGVWIYGKMREKKFKLKIKNFKLLPTLLLP